MYEEALRELESWLHCDEMSRWQPSAEAVRAAIALMRALPNLVAASHTALWLLDQNEHLFEAAQLRAALKSFGGEGE